MSWSNRISLNPLSLFTEKYTLNSLDTKEIMKIIKKYIDLGVVKKFESMDFLEELYE